MKPKLWDGDNPVGEAKERHLQTVGADYLQAHGPGYSAHKRGAFSEVRGKIAPTVLVQDGWFSLSSAAEETQIVMASQDYRENFRRKSEIAQEEGYLFRTSYLGTNGRGRATTTLAKGYEGEDENLSLSLGYAELSLSGRSFVERFSYSVNVAPIHPAAIAGVASQASAATYNLYANATSFVICDRNPYTDDRDVIRSKSSIRVVTKSGDAWLEFTLQPLPEIDYEDCGYAKLCWLSPGTIVALLPHRPNVLPTMHVSVDSGESWSPGVVLTDCFPEIEMQEDDIGEEDDFYIVSWTQARHSYLQTAAIEDLLNATSRSYSSNMVALSSTSFLHLTSAFWAGEVDELLNRKWSLTASVVNIDGAVSAAHTFNAPGGTLVTLRPAAAMNVKVFGKNTWAIDILELKYDLEDDRYFYEVHSRWITFDGGVSYEEKTLVPNVFTVGTWSVIKLTNGEVGDEFRALALGNDDAGNRVLMLTNDLEEFRFVSRVAPANIVTQGSFESVLNVGTPEAPGPITDTSPWSTSTRFQPPAWWTE